MIVTIDGPAGTGKSTVARAAAQRLSLDFLDTGAMYRAVALAAIRRNVNLSDARELAFVAKLCRIEFDWTQNPPLLLLNDEPVTHLLRTAQTTTAASLVAVVPTVRTLLVQAQQRIGRTHPNLVTEGRDQGTIVFPDAPYKFYLDATPLERARRRATQLRSHGLPADQNEILREILSRDQRDSTRKIGPLMAPRDARIIDTTNMPEDHVVDQIVLHIQSGEKPR